MQIRCPFSAPQSALSRRREGPLAVAVWEQPIGKYQAVPDRAHTCVGVSSRTDGIDLVAGSIKDDFQDLPVYGFVLDQKNACFSHLGAPAGSRGGGR